MLVRTPKPYPYESLSSYVLRLSEENGYPTPSNVLKLLGSGHFHAQVPPIDTRKLEKLLGAKKNSLTYLSSCWPGDKTHPEFKARDFRFLGHKLSFVHVYKPIRIHECVICPACILENGYLDAFWELKLAVACPVHKTELLSVCPHCKRHLTWARQGLMRCKCGGYLDIPCDEISSASLLRLMAGLRKAVHRVPRIGIEWDFWRLSRFLHTLYSAPRFQYRFKEGAPSMKERIQAVLDEWPNVEMKLIELDIDAYFNNPLVTPKRKLLKEEVELLKDRYDRQMEVALEDPEIANEEKMYRIIELVDQISDIRARMEKRTKRRSSAKP